MPDPQRPSASPRGSLRQKNTRAHTSRQQPQLLSLHSRRPVKPQAGRPPPPGYPRDKVAKLRQKDHNIPTHQPTPKKFVAPNESAPTIAPPPPPLFPPKQISAPFFASRRLCLGREKNNPAVTFSLQHETDAINQGVSRDGTGMRETTTENSRPQDNARPEAKDRLTPTHPPPHVNQ